MNGYTYTLSYLAVTLAITVGLGQFLHRSGRALLNDAFPTKPALARSVRQLLMLGFYLVCLGYIAMTWDANEWQLRSAVGAINYESTKVGGLLLLLGAAHFLNMLVLARMRAPAGVHAPGGIA